MTGLIHKNSEPCTKSELDWFITPPTQTAVDKGYFTEYFPVANIDGHGPVEFNIAGNGDEYMDLANSYLHIKAKIVKGDNTPIGAENVVAPINLIGHSLFSQVDVSLNDRNISIASNTYPYLAYLETLLNFGEEAKKTMLSCSGYYKDTHMEDDKPDGANTGLKKRYELMKNSKVYDMITYLHSPIFQQNRPLPNLVNLNVKLTRSKPEFCLMSDEATANYKVCLQHISLFVRKIKPSSAVALGHAKALEKGNALYPINQCQCKFYSAPSGGHSFMQDNVFVGDLPKRVILGCIPNATLSGSYKTNPFNFQHQNVKQIALYVDGQSTPRKPLEMNYAENDYITAFHTLFSGFDQDRGLFIDREEYPKGYALYAFDLTPDLCDGPHMNLQHQGSLRIEIKFSEALKETLSILVYAEFDNIIEITKSRQILCDFAN